MRIMKRLFFFFITEDDKYVQATFFKQLEKIPLAGIEQSCFGLMTRYSDSDIIVKHSEIEDTTIIYCI